MRTGRRRRVGGEGRLNAYAITTPQPSPTPVAVSADVRLAIVDYINQARVNAGVPPLTVDDTIMGVAQWRSEDMAARNYFSHFDPGTGSLPGLDAMESAGFPTSGEVLFAASSGYAQSRLASLTVNSGWLNSPSHRQAILLADYLQVGIGVARNRSTWYVTGLLAP